MKYTDNPSVNWLIDELNALQKKNPQFSLRAFAKKLGFSPSYLSQVFQGKKVLSPDAIQQIFENLQLSPEKIKEVNHILENHQRRLDHLSQLQKRLAATRVSDHLNRKTISTDEYLEIADWYHDAIFHSISSTKQTKEMLFSKLDIPPAEIEKALDSLVKFGLINIEDDSYTRNYDSYCFYGDAYPGQLELVKKSFAENQKNFFKRTDDILNSEVDRWTKVTTTYINIPENEIEAALALVDDFNKKLETLFGTTPSEDSKLYALNTQLLPLNKP